MDKTNTNKSTKLVKRLRQLRKEYCMTQEKLGQKLNLKASTISDYENDISFPDNENLIKLAQIFKVTTDYLLGASNIRDRSILTPKDEKDISKDLDKIKEQIKNQENVIANCDGIEITEEDADYLMKAIDLALHRIKQKNKEKYTPKKYK